jgi:tRNA nucleotidyltransferase (CCA-adding enzyme)
MLDYPRTNELSDLAIPDLLSFHQTLTWVTWLINLPVDSIELISNKLAFPAILTASAIAASKIDVASIHGSKPSEITFYLDASPTLAVYAARITAEDENLKQILDKYLRVWCKVKPHTTGDDLKQRGLVPGPKFKEILNRLRAARLDGEVSSESEETKLLEQLIDGNYSG